MCIGLSFLLAEENEIDKASTNANNAAPRLYSIPDTSIHDSSILNTAEHDTRYLMLETAKYDTQFSILIPQPKISLLAEEKKAVDSILD